MANTPSQRKVEERPQYVFMAPDGVGEVCPPVETRYQELPLQNLSWENFERLCFRMAGKKTQAEYWQRYGRQGQAQEGIDIYVRLADGKYEAWQCKRYKQFKAANVKDAVDTFLKGDWKKKTSTLILCVTATIDDTAIQDAIETQADRLKKDGISFLVEGVEKLSERLKKLPELVDDFFGRTWLKAFCGDDSVNQLISEGHLLDGSERSTLRNELFGFYREYFQTIDRGLIVTAGQSIDVSSPPSLLERYIVPDVMISESTSRLNTVTQSDSERSKTIEDVQHENRSDAPSGSDRFEITTSQQSFRRPLGSWLAEGRHAAVLGDAGSGKSTLLRCITLDLLSDQSVFPELAKAWGQYIPIIIPFARWTKMAAANQECGIPLETMLRKWLEQFSRPEKTIQLVCQALKDRRLLLLVDGLDEWANETAARSVLAQIETVVKTQKISAVLSGRPQGVEKLGLSEYWRTARLAPLTEHQQKMLATIWFKSVSSSAQNPQVENIKTHDELIHWEVSNFFRDLRDGGRLNELAGIPLLLTGLISLRIRQVNLPRNRFQAYGELTKLLLEIHPQERSSASADGMPRFQVLIDPEIRQRALARLAYEIRSQGADSGFPINDAKRIIVTFLKDEDELGLASEKAHAGAKELLAVNAETSGILIEKAPEEVGFIHAVFEEHLAATHLARQSIATQQFFVSKNCSDPRWRNVILGLLRQLTRSSDVDQLIGEIESALTDGAGKVVQRLLLAEAAFGESKCSGRTAKRIASEIYQEIEAGSWMPERNALLRIALEGFSNAAMNTELSQHLSQWYPQTQSRWSLDLLFETMEHWPKEQTLVDTFWKGLFDSEFPVRRAAAKTLAKSYVNDLDVGKKLLCSLLSPLDPTYAAPILEALIIGWPDIDGLTELIDSARLSQNQELKFIGIYGAIQQGRHDEQDLKALLGLAHRANRPYEIRNDIADALINGWPGNDLILRDCLSAWSEKFMGWDGVSEEIAQRVLILGYPDNEDVIGQLCEQIASDDGTLFWGMYDPWSDLRKSFFRHPIVAPAFDAWIKQQMDKEYVDEYRMSLAALVSGSPTAKYCLLSSLKDAGGMIFWPVYALLEVWTMQDEEVARALTGLASAELERAQYIAHYLPQIIMDKNECRNKLLDIGRLNKLSRPDFLVQGFAKLGIDHKDQEAVDLVFPYLEGDPPRFSVAGAIINHFGLDTRIKNSARKMLCNLDAPLAEIAWAYRDDPEMRVLILKHATPLPSGLRQVIVNQAKRRCDEVSALDQVLSSYINERNAEVRTSAEIAFYDAYKRRGNNIEKSLPLLENEMRSVGLTHENLRQSAFAGLISLGRVDEFRELKEKLDAERPLTVSAFGASLKKNDALLEHIASNWEQVYKVLGGSIFNRLSSFGRGNQDTCWNELAVYLEPSMVMLKEAFLSYCQRPNSFLYDSSLRALARLESGSPLLLDCCKRIFADKSNHSSYYEVVAQITAGIIIGESYCNESDLGELLEPLGRQKNSGAIIALCLGWSESEIVDIFYEKLMTKQKANITWPAAFYVIGIRGDTEAFENLVLSFINRADGDIWEFQSVCVQIITQKISKDEELFDRLFNRLKSTDASSNERASLPRLLSMSRSGDQQLRDWCENEISKQMSGKKLPDCGLDITSGRVRSLAHILLDVLMPYGPN